MDMKQLGSRNLVGQKLSLTFDAMVQFLGHVQLDLPDRL
jgi:hypothetical protein